MQHLRQSLNALCQADSRFDEAVENVFNDVSSPSNPHGNLAPNLVNALDACCAAGQAARDAVDEHTCLRQPLLHRRATPPAGPLKRAMSPYRAH